jgi:hypothetical protein
MSLENEKETILKLLKARDPLIPPGAPRERVFDIAASAVVTLECLPPHLVDECFAMICDGYLHRLARGAGGVREGQFVHHDPHVLVPVALLQRLADVVATAWEADMGPPGSPTSEKLLDLMQELSRYSNRAPNAIDAGMDDGPG